MKRTKSLVQRYASTFVIVATIAASLAGYLTFIHAASAPPDSDWSFVHGPDGWHYSATPQINGRNVSKLGLAWSADIPSPSGLVGTPIIIEGVVYQSGPGGVVYANEARTGKSKWVFSPDNQYDEDLSLIAFWAMRHNRGLTADKNHVYVSAGNCRLFAIDRKTGQQRWSTKACDPTEPYGITAPPTLGGGMVFIGNSNADMNTSRGFISAFDAQSGKLLWRFYTRPGDPNRPFESDTVKKAAATWGDAYWPASKGGGHVWDSMTYDSKLGLLYFGTNGPVPHNPLERGKNAGDELFATAIVAVNAKTGAYAWHYTTVPRDGWELSAIAPIQIAELPIEGKTTRVVMQAPKNGFLYVLNAETGKFISAGQIAAQNWTKGIDPKTGRPIPNPEAEYWNRPGQDTLMIPGTNGARTWEAMSYSPNTSLVYIPTRTMATLFTKDGSYDWYYPLHKDASIKAEGQLVAWDPVKQKEVWKVIRPGTHNGGAMATGGNLVFQGSLEGSFDAFEASTGKKLWSFQGDGAIMGAPSTAVVDGVQYIFVASGDSGASAQTHSAGQFNSTSKSQGPPRLLAFRLGGEERLVKKPGYSEVKLEKPWRPRQERPLVLNGKEVYLKHGCDLCHGVDAVQAGRDIPDLRGSSEATYSAMPHILKGALRPRGMPGFSSISQPDVVALQAYLTEQAWEGFEAQSARAKQE